MPTEVFLSHSSRDRDFATEVVEALRRHGIPVWYSQTNIMGAQEWHDEIGAALRRCNWFVIILSPNILRSTWAKNELLFALNHRRYKNKIVPLLYRNCRYERLSWTLSNFQIIDFSQSAEDGFRELLRVWGIGYRPPRRSSHKASGRRRI
jgi:TIR domain